MKIITEAISLITIVALTVMAFIGVESIAQDNEGRCDDQGGRYKNGICVVTYYSNGAAKKVRK